MSNVPLPEPHGQFLIWDYHAKPDDPVRYRDVWIDDQLHAHAAAVSAAKDAEIERLRAEVAGLREFVEHVRRNGSTHLASMAIAVLAARKGEA